MLRVEDEVHVQQVSGLLVGEFVKEHVEEVAGVVKVRVWRYRLQSLTQAVVGGGDRWPHGRQADALPDGGFHRVVRYFRVKGAKG